MRASVVAFFVCTKEVWHSSRWTDGGACLRFMQIVKLFADLFTDFLRYIDDH